MDEACTGVILAGGQNSRFAGNNKAFAEIHGQKIIDRIYGVFRQLFDTIILVTNSPELYMDVDALIVSDHFSTRCSLTGVHTALFYTTTPHAFISACDTPFIKKEMIELVLGKIAPHLDIIIPRTELGYEPLSAAYSTKCLAVAERQLKRKQYQIQTIFRGMNVRTIPEKQLRMIDPCLDSFFNVNTPMDLKKAEIMENGRN
ncbi:MAG: molybdenum cofactor guanylyltransferase [Desulfobacteraceae bacterium]|nr:molybdenum cofactor guanylyltransferase [Desulfobacteraceae bacterium]